MGSIISKVDRLNVFLVFLSAALAYLFPIRLLVLVFAILGPLHYFTEIHWLDKKGFFYRGDSKKWFWFALICCFLVVSPKLIFAFFSDQLPFYKVLEAYNSWTNTFIFLAIVIAVIQLFSTSIRYLICFGILSIFATFLFQGSKLYHDFIGLFVPTVIHVYLFTLLFMYFGAKSAKSQWGYIAIVSAIGLPILLFTIPVDYSLINTDTLQSSIYVEEKFYITPTVIGYYLGLTDLTFSFESAIHIKLIMFVAFMYTYHYLNWFSKTTIIQWHKGMSYTSVSLLCCAWFILMGLFYYDYSLGFVVALFFSLLHVILELPLNAKTIKFLIQKKTP